MLAAYHFLIVANDILIGVVFQIIIHRLYPAANFSIALNCQEALQVYDLGKTDLILLCKNLPFSDSLTLTQTVHARNETTPIIKMVHNLAVEAEIEQAGATLLLTEPRMMDELQRLLPRFLIP